MVVGEKHELDRIVHEMNRVKFARPLHVIMLMYL